MRKTDDPPEDSKSDLDRMFDQSPLSRAVIFIIAFVVVLGILAVFM